MKFKSFTHTLKKLMLGACVALTAGLIVSCTDDDKENSQKPFDPNQPVQITRFTPETGGYQQQILVYGNNFGTEKENVALTIGGKPAVIVSVMSDKMYAYIPAGAMEGTIEVTVTDPETGISKTATCDKKLNYEAKTVVGTLCGYKNQDDTQGEEFGPFATTVGFRYEGCMTFDPRNPNLIYVVYDAGHYIVQLDLENKTHTRLMSSSKFQDKRLRNAAFTLDGEYMLVSTDTDNNNLHSNSLWIVKRSGDGTFNDKCSTQLLASYRQCNGVAVHPVNGEVYFNSYYNGQLFRLDLDDYFAAIDPAKDDDVADWTGYIEDGAFEELFQIMDPSYEFNITIHPSGDYAYLVLINRHYILRTDYDWNKKRFTTPYLVAGYNGSAAWEDAVGGDARMSRPYQGIFVKNQNYVDQGYEDEYDFYFTDCTNFCVRYITPDGLVRTYAGHSPSTDGNIWGTEDGDLRTQARFRDVTGLAYDEKRDVFYVLDHNNRRIRTIGKESEDNLDVVVPPADEEEGGEGNDPGTEEDNQE